jgi:hypothetical protein
MISPPCCDSNPGWARQVQGEWTRTGCHMFFFGAIIFLACFRSHYVSLGSIERVNNGGAVKYNFQLIF